MKNYKQPLTVKQQVDYLEQHKRVVYNDISKEDAQEFLYTHNYINVISPFKEKFAKQDKKGNVIRDSQNNHIYERDIDFNEYINAYNDERNNYPKIYRNIMKFETTFNSILSNEVILYYDITNYGKFNLFCEILEMNLAKLENNKKYSYKIIDKMENEISKLKNDMYFYENIYILLDRISLPVAIAIFRSIDDSLKTKIYRTLNYYDMTFGCKTFASFDEYLTRLPNVRNYVAHFNSLEILVNYIHIKNKDKRHSSDKKKYTSLITKLSK